MRTLHRISTGRATLYACLFVMFAANTASAAAIESISYSITGGTASCPLCFISGPVGLVPGSAVTYTPNGSSLVPGAAQSGGNLVIASFGLTQPLVGFGIGVGTFSFIGPFGVSLDPLAASSAATSLGPVAISWLNLTQTVMSGSGTTFGGTTFGSVVGTIPAGAAVLMNGASIAWNQYVSGSPVFTFSVTLGNEVRTLVPEPATGTLLVMAGLAMLGAGVAGRRFAVRTGQTRID